MRAAFFLAAALAAQTGSYRQQTEAWRDQQEQQLKGPDSWLAVAGLFWLEPGANTVGTSEKDAVSLPPGSAPARVGTITMAGGRIELRTNAPVKVNGKPVTAAELHAGASPQPDTVEIGRLKLLLIKRGERYAIRLKDPESKMRREFTGRKWFPVDESWRIQAKFVPYPAPRKISFDTVVGTKEEMESPGYVTFTRAGKEYRLEPVREGRQLFFVFRDATSGKTTYGASRFLYAAMPANGTVVLDFNRAVNPPCAFTPYATCPLPPKQNRLALAITAGEKNYGNH
jgi:uncharacterized protein (DUF1684 family)